jgi:phosphatidylglycerol:prolipoprotein diacylglycerol transferase
MMPVILRFGNFRLTSYVALIALAGVVTLFYFKHFESKLGLKKREDFWFLANLIGLSGFLGGRLLYLASTPMVFIGFRGFAAALVSNEIGLSTFGALLGALAGVSGGCWYLGLNFLRVLDHVCLAIPLGHAIARLGCFLNGCCYGRAVDGHPAWSVVFTDPSAALPPGLLGVPLHPAQLYEAAGDLLLAGMLYFLVLPRVGKGRFGPGLVTAAYVAGYGVLRYVVEVFRGSPELMSGTAIPLAQIFSLVMIPVAAIFMFVAVRWRPAAVPPPPSPSNK